MIDSLSFVLAGDGWFTESSLLHLSKIVSTDFPQDFKYIASWKPSHNLVITILIFDSFRGIYFKAILDMLF
jgi:hypothetical protein